MRCMRILPERYAKTSWPWVSLTLKVAPGKASKISPSATRNSLELRVGLELLFDMVSCHPGGLDSRPACRQAGRIQNVDSIAEFTPHKVAGLQHDIGGLKK